MWENASGKVTDIHVRFAWNDYRNSYAKQQTILKGEDFLGLFTRHILPHGYTRIRHYGFLSSASKQKSLPLIRASLGVSVADVLPQSIKWQEIALERMGVKPGVCKCCGGEMKVVLTLPNLFRKSSRGPPVKNIPKAATPCINNR